MKYNVYAIAEGATIATSEALAAEETCFFCHSSWFAAFPFDAGTPCPYCGEVSEYGTFRVSEQSSRASSYGRDIRGVVRSLWAGVIDEYQAYELLQGTIRIGLTRAWMEGAAECGILANELTPEERQALDEAIFSETSHIDGLIDYVIKNSKANGGKLATVLGRAQFWERRYSDVVNRAKIMACGNQKLEWVLGPTEHCPSCAKLAGQVRRASFWQKKQVHPQNPPNPNLECKGFGQCTLQPTDAQCSRGPLPKLP